MQAMSELIPVTVVIADRSYRVRIRPEDEEILRKTTKTIGERLLDYKTQFAGKDMQDYVAMVLISFATEQNAAGTQQLENHNITERLAALERMLDNQLP
jgi:cell division protein ZapA (FtsZ GTPase activity inhibitor)